MTTTNPTRRAKAAALARDTRITKSIRSIEAGYQNQVDELQERLDGIVAHQRTGYVDMLLEGMREVLGFESFEALEAIRTHDAVFAPQIEAVAGDVGRQAFVLHRYARAVEGTLTTAAATVGAPYPDEDMVDDFLLEVRRLNRTMRGVAVHGVPMNYLVGTAFAPDRDCMRVKEAA